MENFINHLKIFIYLQSGLWTELLHECSLPITFPSFNIPKCGAVQFDKKTWIFKKHGIGVRFKEKNGKRVIDFHRVDIGSNFFDPYGVSIYFGSLGGEGRKLLQAVGIHSGSLEQNIKLFFVELEENNIIHKKSIKNEYDIYEFVDDLHNTEVSGGGC